MSLSRSGKPIPLDNFESPLLLGSEDALIIKLGNDEYVFWLSIKGRWGQPSNQNSPKLLIRLLEQAVKLGLVESFGVGTGQVYVAEADAPVQDVGLCPCFLRRFLTLKEGDWIQLWTGQCLQHQDGKLNYLAKAWTPGLDSTPPQKSRTWES